MQTETFSTTPQGFTIEHQVRQDRGRMTLRSGSAAEYIKAPLSSTEVISGSLRHLILSPFGLAAGVVALLFRAFVRR